MHQSAFLRALPELGHDTTLIVDRVTNPMRAAMGWEDPELGDVRVLADPSKEAIDILTRSQDNSVVHIIGGFHGSKIVKIARQRCRGLRVGLMSENADGRGFKGMLRKWNYRIAAFRYARNLDFILGIGQQGINWYREAGFDSDIIFPFCYTTEPMNEARFVTANDKFEIVYIGGLQPWKGPDILLDALAQLPGSLRNSQSWNVKFIGDGPLREEMNRRISEEQIAAHVEITGFLPHSNAMKLLESADLLVAPSRYDGWGAVVNEAHARGSPVLCSHAVGASDLIQTEAQGDVFGSIAELAAQLEKRILAGPNQPATREKVRLLAANASGSQVAKYTVSVMRWIYEDGERPDAPWLSGNPQEELYT